MKRVLAIACMIIFSSGVAFSQTDESIEIQRLVPMGGNLHGWNLNGDVTHFDAQNLYLHINGQAEMYLDYGFVIMVSADYEKKGDKGIVSVDIYDMGDKDHALGIYTAEKDGTATKVAVGAQGYMSAYILNFWKGPYYIKVFALAGVQDLKKVLLAFAEAIDKKMPSDTSLPMRALRLNKEGIIPGSTMFFPKGFLGHGFINNTYSAQYSFGDDNEVRMFISEYKSSEAALAAFRKYRDFVSKDKDKRYEELKGFGEISFYYGDRFNKEYIIVKKDTYLCGAVGDTLVGPQRTLLKDIIPE